jgi:hypothetical protein
LNRLGARFAVALAVASCIGEPRVEEPRRGGFARELERALDVREASGAPPVLVIAREGDPEPAVALAFFGEVTSEEAAALAAAFSERLRAPGVAVRSRSDRRSLIVTLSGAVDMEKALAALRSPLVGGPWAVEVLAALSAIPTEGTPASQRLADCAGRAGRERPTIDPATPMGLEALERARQRLLAADRAAVAVVGERAFADAVAQAVADFEWGARGASPPVDGASSVVVEHLPSEAASVEVALRAVDAKAALRVAAEIEAQRSPLTVHAERLGLRLRHAAASIDPRGGCMVVRLDAAAAPSEDVLAEWLGLARADLARADPFDVGAMIRARDAASETAEVAAWWALARNSPRSEAAALAVLTHGERALPGLAEVLRRSDDARGPAPSFVVQSERGHTEDWLVVASPCAGAVAGTAQYAGAWLAAATVGRRERRDGVVVEPMIAGGAVGFLAHAPSPADPRTLANRAVAAFFEAPSALPARLDAWASMHATLTGRFGVVDEALSAAAAAGGPSLEPFALPRDAPRLGEGDLRAALRALSEGPLSIAGIGSFEGLEDAADEVARFRPPGAPKECPAVSPMPAQRVELASSAPGRASLVAVLQPSAHAGVVAELLRRSPSLVFDPPGRTSVEVLARGRSEVVLLTLRGAPELLEGRASKLEAALSELARASDEALADAISESERTQRRETATVRGRLVALVRGGPTQKPASTELRAVLAEPLVGRPLTFVARPRT